MKIVSFNCSPRMKTSNTDKILKPLFEGAREAGAQVEEFYARKLKIAPCTGCLGCWLKTPGVCCQKDDAEMVRQKMMGADITVLATPIYFFNMTSYMKNLMERAILPMVLPYLKMVDGHMGHPTKFPNKTLNMLLVANAGFWGEDVFEPLLHTLDRLRQAGVDEEGHEEMHFVGNILVGFGEIMQTKPFLHFFEPFFEELRAAGRELVERGELSEETCEKLAVPLYTYMNQEPEQTIEMANTYFKAVFDKLEQSAE
jgi:NADPH-dependent FMN reductase